MTFFFLFLFFFEENQNYTYYLVALTWYTCTYIHTYIQVKNNFTYHIIPTKYVTL